MLKGIKVQLYYGVKKDVTSSITENNQIQLNEIFFKLYATFTLGQQKSILLNKQPTAYFLRFINSLMIKYVKNKSGLWSDTRNNVTVNTQDNLSNDFYIFTENGNKQDSKVPSQTSGSKKRRCCGGGCLCFIVLLSALLGGVGVLYSNQEYCTQLGETSQVISYNYCFYWFLDLLIGCIHTFYIVSILLIFIMFL